MWIVRVETAAQAAKKGSQAKPAKTKFIPLQAGKTLKLGRGSELDVPVDHASVSKSAGRIVLGKWQDKVDKHGSIALVPIEYYNDTQISGSKLTLEEVEKDPTRQKVVVVLHPTDLTPRTEDGRISNEATEADYQELNEWGKIEIEDGTIVQLTKSAKLTFTWRSYVFADSDQTADKIQLAQRLRAWGISHQKKVFTRLTTHVVVPQINVSSSYCMEAVSAALYIVNTEFIEELLRALDSFSSEDGVTLPAEHDYMPEISKVDGTGIKLIDARKESHWWEPIPARRKIWEGTTVLIMGDGKKDPDDVSLINGGARLLYMDVNTRPPRSTEDLKKKMKPILLAATEYHQQTQRAVLGKEGGEWSQPVMVILYRRDALQTVGEKWEGDESFTTVLIEGPKPLGILVEFFDNWWITLTKPDCLSLFEESEEPAATQRATQIPQSQYSTQQPSRVLRRGDTEIPSTHPDEGVSDSQSQKSVEPAPPAGKTILKRRAGGKVNPFSFDMSSDEEEPPVKRTRSQAPATLASQVPNTQISTTEPVPIEKATLGDTYESRLGLKRRAGTRTKSGFFDFDDSRDGDDDDAIPASTNDPLAKFRSLYDSKKNKSGVPDSMPADGMDYDQLYTQAKSQARATAGTTASQMDVDVEDEEGGFLEHIKKQRQAEKDKLRMIEEEESEEPGLPGLAMNAEASSSGDRASIEDVAETRSTQKAAPTRPENVSKDETFLKAASKVKRGNAKVDEFDLEFNALKISKPTKAVPMNPKIMANKARQTDEELYRLLEDMDTSTTGNFIVIERVDMYRKDKQLGEPGEAPLPNPEWAGKKNFKKFKKQHVAHQPPIPMILKSAVDYGLGTTYWANEGAAAPTAEAPSQSQAPTATPSQARTARTATQAGSQPLVKGRRKLLAADSDDDDIPVRPIPRTGRTQTSATPEPTPAVPATRTARTRNSRTLTPSDAGDEPAAKATRGRKKAIGTIMEDEELDQPEIEVIEPSGGTRGTRRGTRGTTSRGASVMGDSTQAEEYMPLRGSSTTVAPGTAATATASGKANRKRMIMDSDDDDAPIIARKRKKH